MGDDELGSEQLDLEELFKEPEPESLEWYQAEAHRIYNEIANRFGDEAARLTFDAYVKPPKRISLHEIKKWEVLTLYYGMKPWRNKLKLARDLAEKNKRLPKEKRYGKGSTDMNTFKKYIDRAVKDFEKTNLSLLMYGGSAKPTSKPKKKR